MKKRTSVKQKKIAIRVLMAGLIIVCLFSCEKEVETNKTEYPEIIPGNGLFILNEGNFQWGNSSVSFYNKNTGETWHNLFRIMNNEGPGDVLQSGTIHNGQLFLVVNNSGKIEVMDPESGYRTATISGMTSPRHMLIANESKAYVSDLYAGLVYIIDMHTNSISGSISINGWTEALLMSEDNIIISGMESGMLYSVNTNTEQLEDSLLVGPAPNSMVIDNNGMLWVLCGGDLESNQGSQLVKVNPFSWEVIRTIELEEKNHPYSGLTLSNDGETLFFSGGNVYKYEIDGNQNPPEILIPSGGMTFYGLGVDPQSGEIYISDAIDYVQQGKIMRYSNNGQLLDEFFGNIIPVGFVFY